MEEGVQPGEAKRAKRLPHDYCGAHELTGRGLVAHGVWALFLAGGLETVRFGFGCRRHDRGGSVDSGGWAVNGPKYQ